MVAEFFLLGEPVVDFPVISPRTVPVYRRVDATIDFEQTQKAFPGTDLMEQFFVRWRGVIRIPAAGEYTFSLQSDDGSRLYIDGQLVVDNGGLHHWIEKSGKVELTAGDHNIQVEYFQNGVFSGCQLFWENENFKKEIVPASVFFHRPTTEVVDRDAWFIPIDGSYHPRLWQGGDGLPHNSASVVTQTRDGYLWLGTPKGLARFDGIRFVVFEPPDAPELKNAPIKCLHQSDDGTLWIGPEKGGLLGFKNGQCRRITLPADAQTRALLETKDGSLWIGTTKGLGLSKNEKLTWLTAADGLFGEVILSFCEDRDGTFWIGSNRGLMRRQDEKFTSVYEVENGQVRAICQDHEGNLWFASGANGLVRMKGGQFHTFKKADGLPDELISAIFEDSRKALWVGTFAGLCRLSSERFVTEMNSDGTAYDTVFSLTEDNEGSVWLGTKEGLSQLRLKPFKAYTQRQGLPHNNIMSVCEDRHGTIWMAAWGGGLSGLKNGQVTIYKRENTPLYDQLLSIRETSDGSLWLGSDHHGGLFQFKDGKFRRYGELEGLADPVIRVILEDRQGTLWLGTSSSLYRMRDGKFERFTTEQGLTGNMIRALHEDRHGRLWIGTQDGLTIYRDGKFARLTTEDGLSANAIISFHEDREGNLWFGTDGGGICRIKNEKLKMENQETGDGRQETGVLSHASRITNHVSRFTSQHGLFSDTIYEILEDDRGYFWMSCFSGIFRVRAKDFDEFDKGTLKSIPCVVFGKTEGLSSVQCNGVAKPAGWKGKDGRLWFPTTRGVVVVDPNAVRETDPPPTVLIEEIIADKHKVAGGEWRVARSASDPVTRHPSPVTIAPGHSEFEFHYTALSFRSPEKNQFKYKLEGVDSDWVEAGTRRVAYYNNLPPRDYTFRVIAANSDGDWNQLGENVKFTLQPYFWQTKWFLVLVIVAAVGAVGSVTRYVAWKNMQRRLARLEQQHAVEKERSRIARDLHDDLGARLTEILMQNDVAGRRCEPAAEVKIHLGKVSQQVNQLVGNLDAIVWAADPKNDSLDHFITYVFEYLDGLASISPIRILRDVPTGLTPCPLSAEQRHNLFLVIKEAMNNVFKHSCATEVWFRLSWKAPVLSIVIEDNGHGFSTGTTSELGNGLLNMQKRMSAIGGTWHVTSAPGKGTRVEMVVSINGKHA